jgi:hypothetical protein
VIVDHLWAVECIQVYRRDTGEKAGEATKSNVDANLGGTLVRLLLDWHGYRAGKVDRNQMVNTLRETELLLLGMICNTLADVTTPGPQDNDTGGMT